MATPDLPIRFPCWVKAIYSWGGETKRDLGFIEGDLIECLNAGDGSWWTGRLRRDRRMVGLFPSNFVQVLSDDFQPTPRPGSATPSLRASPSISRAGSPYNSASNTPSPEKSKSTFRRPFTAYSGKSSPGATSPAGSISKTSKNRGPYASMRREKYTSPAPAAAPQRAPSPKIPTPIARATSPLPPMDFSKSTSRAAMPHETDFPRSVSRAASPQPRRGPSRAHSPVIEEDFVTSSPPPPPPPAHRVAYNRYPGPGLQEQEPERNIYSTAQYGGRRTPSPAPSEQHSGYTPSPLRNAMDGVMDSLDVMSLSRSNTEAQEPTSTNIWSPDAFDEIYSASVRKTNSITVMRHEPEENSPITNSILTPSHHIHSQTGKQPQQYGSRVSDDIGYYQIPSESSYAPFSPHDLTPPAPMPPPQSILGYTRPQTAYASSRTESSPSHTSASVIYQSDEFEFKRNRSQRDLRTRKSAYELGKEKLQRTFSTKTSVTTISTAQSTSTNNSSSTQATSQSIMSGYSASGFSATSAGSLARRKWGRSGSVKSVKKATSMMEMQRPGTSMSAISYHSSHASGTNQNPHAGCEPLEWSSAQGGYTGGVEKKRGFLKKMLDTAKTSAATVRSRPPSRGAGTFQDGVSAIYGGLASVASAQDMGLGNTVDWVEMRRDVNRSNSLSRNETNERAERCQMMDVVVLRPVDILHDTEGDEGADGYPIANSTDFTVSNLALVDKNARFINSLPALVNSISLAQGYLCRPYRSDVQRLRAIFTWVAERIAWEEDFEGDIDTRRVLQTRRGCSEEITVLVTEMCAAVNIHAEVVRGYLKTPGEPSSQEIGAGVSQPNHWWNAVLVDGAWRIMDCSLAGPSNPRRNLFSSTGNQVSDPWWFLVRPMEACYTHVPEIPEQQHIVSPLPHEVLMALPVPGPACFKNNIRLWDFDTSMLYLEGLEMAHIQLTVPDDVECVAEVEARAFARDADGDFFESGDIVRKRALAQGEFISCGDGATAFKRYTIKALLPPSAESNSFSNTATLKIYAGRRGLMHSVSKNPHSLALALPLAHQGINPAYEFFTKHPTPHALRHEIYVTGPLCKRLVCNSTFVFGVRQHPASTMAQSGTDSVNFTSRPTSSLSTARPSSAMSMASISMSGSAYSNPCATGSDLAQQQKPAKLAVQSPSGKIIRMTRKVEQRGRLEAGDDDSGARRVGSSWETVVKIGERGTWRGLVLADRSARWCVFGEWVCV